MIDRPILERLRHGVCAIGYLQEPLENGRPLEVAGWFKVVGTGFLVRKETVITNGHVLDALDSETKTKGIPDTQRFLLFVVIRRGRVYASDKPGAVTVRGEEAITPRQVRSAYALRGRDADVALIEFAEVYSEHFASVEPVELDDPRSVCVSESIAVYGYALSFLPSSSRDTLSAQRVISALALGSRLPASTSAPAAALARSSVTGSMVDAIAPRALVRPVP